MPNGERRDQPPAANGPAQPTLRDRMAHEASFAAWLEARLDEARRAWPEVVVEHERFVDYLAARVEHDIPVEDLFVRDLYLACACAAGDPAAVATFERSFGQDMAIALGRHEGRGVVDDDLKQQLRERLFAPPEPKIAGYAGRGSLKGWLRVTLLRLRIDAERRRKARPELPRAGASAMVDERALDPEMLHMKRLYGAAFVQSLDAAIVSLTPRERNLLRFKIRDDLDMPQVARMYRVHRATVKRWLADARERLLERTRSELQERTGATPSQLDSILRLIESQLDVSIRGMLGPDTETDPDALGSRE